MLNVKTADGTVSIEPFALTVRFHGDGEHGDPFNFVATMTRHGDEATVFAAHGEFTLRIRRAIVEALKSIGIKRVRYQRMKPERFYVMEE